MSLNRLSSGAHELPCRLGRCQPVRTTLRGGSGEVLSKVVAPVPLRRLLSGTDVGHPVHPVLVQIPIGCWSSTWALDLMGLGKTTAARRLVGLGVLAALPAVASGVSDWVDTDEAEARVGLVHAASNAVAIACFAASWLSRRGNRRSGALWSTLGIGVATLGGLLGGHLAYALGVGVDTNAFETGPNEWTAARGNVPTEPLVAAHVGGGARDGGAERRGAIRIGRPLQPPGRAAFGGEPSTEAASRALGTGAASTSIPECLRGVRLRCPNPSTRAGSATTSWSCAAGSRGRSANAPSERPKRPRCRHFPPMWTAQLQALAARQTRLRRKPQGYRLYTTLRRE